MKTPITYTITLNDDYEQIDTIVRLRLIEALDDMAYDGEYDDPELAEAVLRTLESFSTEDQWNEFKKRKGDK